MKLKRNLKLMQNKSFVLNLFKIVLCLLLFCFNVYAQTESKLSQKIKQTIMVIPASEFNQSIKGRDEGIFLQLDEYRRLFAKAKKEYLIRVQKKEPLPYQVQITSARYTGILKKNLISFKAWFNIHNYHEKVQVLPFPLKGVLLKKALFNQKDVQFYEKDNILQLVLPSCGSYELFVEFDVPITFTNKKANVFFNVPETPIGEMKLLTPLFYDLNLKDFRFSSKIKIKDQFEISAFTGGKNSISFGLNNQRSFSEREVKLISNENHIIKISHERIESQLNYQLNIKDGEAQKVELEMPKNVHVTNISGKGISTWERSILKNNDLVTIYFFVPVKDKCTFSVATVQSFSMENEFSILDVHIRNQFFRKGKMSVFYFENIRIHEKQKNCLLTRNNLKVEAFAPIPRYKLYRSYQFFNSPFALHFKISKPVSKIQSIQSQSINFERSKINFCSYLKLYNFQKPQTVFCFSFPESFFLKEVSVIINNQSIKEFHEFNENKNQITVEIRKPVTSRDSVEFYFKSEKQLNPELLKKDSVSMNLPDIQFENSTDTKGTLKLSLDSIFLLEELRLNGLSPSENMIFDSTVSSQKVLTYDFKTTDHSAFIKLTYQKPEIISQTANFITVDKELIKVNSFIKFSISGGSLDSLYFAIPKWENSKINIQGLKIKEKKKISKSAFMTDNSTCSFDIPENFDIWHILLQTQISDNYILKIDYQFKYPLENQLFDIPLIHPVQVKNDNGYLIVEASKSTDIQITQNGLNEIETFELPKWPGYQPSRRIISSLRYFVHPFNFKMSVTRREELPVLSSLIETLEMVFTIADSSSVFFEYQYKIKNTSLQFFEIELPENHTLWAATVDQKGIKPRRGNGKQILISLPQGKESLISIQLSGIILFDNQAAFFSSFQFLSPKTELPCLSSKVYLYYPKTFKPLNMSGNFKEIQKQTFFEQPLLLSLLNSTCSVSWFPIAKSIVAVSSPSSGIGDEMVQKAPSFSSEDRRKGRSFLSARKKSKRKSGFSYGKIAEKKSKHSIYQKKKGLLSLNLAMPRIGNLISLSKLWGDNVFKIRFIKKASYARLKIVIILFFIALGFFCRRFSFISPFMFFLFNLTFFTCLPFIVLRGFVLICNSAIVGSFLFLLVHLAQQGFKLIIDSQNSFKGVKE